MSGVTGRSMKMAFAKHGLNSWGVPASVTKGIYFSSDGGLQYKPAQITDDAFGQTFVAPADPGLIEAPALSLTGRDRYDDYTYVWEALAMGSPATVAISTSATGQVTSWTHQMDLADAIDGLGLTFAIDRQLYVEEVTSAKVHGFELTQDGNGAMNITFRVLGSQPTNASTTNITATLTGATYPALTNRVMQHQGTFRINLNSAGALGATDAISAESIKLSVIRPQDGPHVYGQQYIAEPADNGFPELMVELTHPRMNTISANSMYGGLIAGTAFKADWTFLSTTYINSTDRWKKLYQFPYLQLLEDGFQAATNGAQQVKPSLKFACRLAPTSPTGMPFVRPVRLTRTMQNSVHAFV